MRALAAWPAVLVVAVCGSAVATAAADPSGTIVYATSTGTQSVLRTVGGGGGASTTVFSSDPLHPVYYPVWDPGSQRIAFMRSVDNAAPESGTQSLLSTISASGADLRDVIPRQPYGFRLGLGAAWSPDGSRIVFFRQGAVWVVNADGSNARFLSNPGWSATWSPDSTQIAFFRNNPYPAAPDLVRKNLTTGVETTMPIVLPSGAALDYVAGLDWSPDGTRIAVIVTRDTGGCKQYIALVQVDTAAISPDPGAGASSCLPTPQSPSWSPDGSEIAVRSNRLDAALKPHYSIQALKVATGTVRTIVPEGDLPYDIPGLDWAPSTGPNLFVDRVEVAQAISPFADDPAHQPPPANPQAAENDAGAGPVRDRLVAGKSTFVRVYVSEEANDSAVYPTLRIRLSGSRGGTQLGDLVKTVTTLRVDKASARERQASNSRTANFVLPASWASGSVDLSVDISVADDFVKECRGCERQGNAYTVRGLRFQNGGKLELWPYKIDMLWPGGLASPPDAARLTAIPDAGSIMPVAPGSLIAKPWQGSIAVDPSDAAVGARGLGICMAMLAKIKEVALNTPASDADYTTRTVGFFPSAGLDGAPDVLRKPDCGGLANQPGTTLVVRAQQGTEGYTLAHELGHSVGLVHARCPSPVSVPDGEVPLPYAGIGGVGYDTFSDLSDVLVKSDREDVMSYCLGKQWTSPVTWQAMFTGFGGQAASAARAAPTRTLGRAASTARSSGRVAGRVLVIVGLLDKGRARILNAYPLEGGATLPPVPDAANTIAKVSAVAANGRQLAIAALPRTVDSTAPKGSPELFVAALPTGSANPAGIIVRAPGGAVLTRTRRSKHAPAITLAPVAKPRAVSRRKPLTLRWRATDADGDPLAYTVLVAAGRGPYRTASPSIRKPRMKLDLSLYRPGTRLRIRVIASDGLRFTTATSQQLTVAR